MKALKFSDLLVVGLFMIGLLVGVIHIIQTEFVLEEIEVEVATQYVILIEPKS